MTEIEMSTETETALEEERTFEPSRYLRKLGGKDYLEVKWRLLWLRTERPEAIINTELHTLDVERGFALFKAFVSDPGNGEATGWGSETQTDFFDYIEKAETKALGRALAALGYGTQFCDDHDFQAEPIRERADKVVDSPVDRSQVRQPSGQQGGPLSTPAQLKLIYMTATRDLNITEEELEERCNAQYGRLPLHLTKREASEFIDALKAGQVAPPPAQPKPAPQPAPAVPPAQPAQEASGLPGYIPPAGARAADEQEKQLLATLHLAIATPEGDALLEIRRAILAQADLVWDSETIERNVKGMRGMFKTKGSWSEEQIVGFCAGIHAACSGHVVKDASAVEELLPREIYYLGNHTGKLKGWTPLATALAAGWMKDA